MIIVKTPFTFSDYIMGANRTFGNICSIAGEVSIDGTIERLRFSNVSGNSALNKAEDFREFSKLTETDYKKLKLNPQYNLGQVVLYQNSNYDTLGRLAEGKITSIQFIVSNGYSLYYYIIDGKKNVDIYNIYSNREDFIKRTAPKTELKENERLFYTRFLMQQNYLVPVFVTKFGKKNHIGQVRYQYNHGSNQEYTRKSLHKKPKGFYNEMFEEINREKLV